MGIRRNRGVHRRGEIIAICMFISRGDTGTVGHYRWLYHESLHFIDGCSFILEGDLDIPNSQRLELGCYSLGAGDCSLEPGPLRVIDHLIFTIIIAVIPIGINIIGKRHSDDKPARVPVVQLTQAISAEFDGINRSNFAEIDLDPAVFAVADPAGPGAI
jgi:hypothetical protein